VLQEQLLKLELEIPHDCLVQLELLVDELLRWTKRRNLTAITDRDEVLEKHLVDSLTMLPFARQASRLLDIGSGAGFPALPLKIVCPALEVVSVDAVGKKIDFQKHIARKFGLLSFTGLHARIQDLQEDESYRSGFDLVTARALTSLEDLAIPVGFDYDNVGSLSAEVREKLMKVAPRTLGQAGRIPGVTPAAIAILSVILKR
jgi:16S rRNA (guanine527-N7)-methyltransferase